MGSGPSSVGVGRGITPDAAGFDVGAQLEAAPALGPVGWRMSVLALVGRSTLAATARARMKLQPAPPGYCDEPRFTAIRRRFFGGDSASSGLLGRGEPLQRLASTAMVRRGNRGQHLIDQQAWPRVLGNSALWRSRPAQNDEDGRRHNDRLATIREPHQLHPAVRYISINPETACSKLPPKENGLSSLQIRTGARAQAAEQDAV